MFLTLNHQRLEVFTTSRSFVLECYKLSKKLPTEERFGMVSQIRRAALSVHLNVAEGCSRRSEAERRRFYEISRGSLIEIDAALDIAVALDYFQMEDVDPVGTQMVNCFKMLSGMLATHH